jgi:hypothetical protein
MAKKRKARKFNISAIAKPFADVAAGQPKLARHRVAQPCQGAEESANRALAEYCASKHFTLEDLMIPDLDLAPGDYEGPCEGCKPVELPLIRPCFKLRWGDGPNDRIETDDTEVLCLTAWNPYSNIAITDLIAYVWLADSNLNPPQPLPDGTPSVWIRPSTRICFGDIPPCDENKPNERPSVSRELVLVSRGAQEGTYVVLVGYCYSVRLDLSHYSLFELDLVAS